MTTAEIIIENDDENVFTKTINGMNSASRRIRKSTESAVKSIRWSRITNAFVTAGLVVGGAAVAFIWWYSVISMVIALVYGMWWYALAYFAIAMTLAQLMGLAKYLLE